MEFELIDVSQSIRTLEFRNGQSMVVTNPIDLLAMPEQSQIEIFKRISKEENLEVEVLHNEVLFNALYNGIKVIKSLSEAVVYLIMDLLEEILVKLSLLVSEETVLEHDINCHFRDNITCLSYFISKLTYDLREREDEKFKTIAFATLANLMLKLYKLVPQPSILSKKKKITYQWNLNFFQAIRCMVLALPGNEESISALFILLLQRCGNSLNHIIYPHLNQLLGRKFNEREISNLALLCSTNEKFCLEYTSQLISEAWTDKKAKAIGYFLECIAKQDPNLFQEEYLERVITFLGFQGYSLRGSIVEVLSLVYNSTNDKKLSKIIKDRCFDTNVFVRGRALKALRRIIGYDNNSHMELIEICFWALKQKSSLNRRVAIETLIVFVERNPFNSVLSHKFYVQKLTTASLEKHEKMKCKAAINFIESLMPVNDFVLQLLSSNIVSKIEIAPLVKYLITVIEFKMDNIDFYNQFLRLYGNNEKLDRELEQFFLKVLFDSFACPESIATENMLLLMKKIYYENKSKLKLILKALFSNKKTKDKGITFLMKLIEYCLGKISNVESKKMQVKILAMIGFLFSTEVCLEIGKIWDYLEKLTEITQTSLFYSIKLKGYFYEIFLGIDNQLLPSDFKIMIIDDCIKYLFNPRMASVKRIERYLSNCELALDFLLKENVSISSLSKHLATLASSLSEQPNKDFKLARVFFLFSQISSRAHMKSESIVATLKSNAQDNYKVDEFENVGDNGISPEEIDELSDTLTANSTASSFNFVVEVAIRIISVFKDTNTGPRYLLMTAFNALVSGMLCNRRNSRRYMKKYVSFLVNDNCEDLNYLCLSVLPDFYRRFPNVIQPYQQDINGVLGHDVDIARHALVVLSYLMVNDYIKVKHDLSPFASLVIHEEEAIRKLSRQLFVDLGEKKSNGVYNIFVETINRLSKNLDDHDFNAVAQFLASFLSKSQIPTIQARLCQKIFNTKCEMDKVRLGFLIFELKLTEKGILVLYDHYREYKMVMKNPQLFQAAKKLLKKGKLRFKANLKIMNILNDLSKKYEKDHKIQLKTKALLADATNFAVT